MTLINSDDLNELLGAFIAETQEFLQLLENHLLAMENAESAEARQQLVKEMFRAAHSIKGSALMFGFEDLSHAAHALEDGFAILRDRADLSELKSATVSALLSGVDRLKSMTEKSTATVTESGTPDSEELQEDAKEIAQIKAQLEAEYGTRDESAQWVQKNPASTTAIQSIFEQELPPILDRLETELSQLTRENQSQTLGVLNETYYQLSGLAGMLQLPEFGEIADRLRAIVDAPQLSPEELQQLGWAIAQNLQSAREQVLHEQPIAIEPFELPGAQTPPQTPAAEPSPPQPEPQPPAPTPPAPTPPAQDPSVVVRPTIRVELDSLTELVNLVGELVINRTHLELQETQLRSEVKRLRRHIRDLNQFGVQLREEYDRLAGESAQPLTPSSGASENIGSAAHQSLFDSLELDTYGEFHSTAQETIETTQAIARSGTQIDDVALNLERSTDRLRRICERLRSRVMQLRVVSFSRAVDRLPRAIRELSRTHNKEVNLLLLGRETKIDESLLHALRDPLVHLVRNAFDHGIETPEERQQAGKPLSGQIEIEARHQGGQTIITVSDDGKGIDPDRVRSRVVELGWVSEEQAAELSLNELYEFLFWPGFSTAGQVTDLSGRGVGLDVVRNNLQQVRGTVKVDSRLGKGTSFIIKLPLMLSIADALLVRIAHHTLAVPLDAVEEIVHVQPSHIHMALDRPMLRWREEYIRLVPLQNLLHYPQDPPDNPSPVPVGQDYIPVLVLSSSDGIVAIAVERLVGQQEIVVKPLPHPLSKPHTVLGCTILGNGEVVSILDVDDIVGELHPEGSNLLPMKAEIQPGTPAMGDRSSNVRLLPPPPSQPLILVVDDSYTIRQMLSLTLSRARYRVAQAKDGQDAMEQLHEGLNCSLIVADIEMPRMDGFQLLKTIKEHPHFCHIPVAVLTSRSGAKHRQTAMELGASQYFTKPYNERQFLDAIAKLV